MNNLFVGYLFVQNIIEIKEPANIEKENRPRTLIVGNNNTE